MKKKKGRHVGIEVTGACNLRCRMCFLSRHKALKNELTTNEIHGLIDQFAEMDIETLGITGGEPLLRKDVFSIIDYAKDKGLKVRMVTNSTLLNEKVARKLNVDGVLVSVDGLEEANDWNRGCGVFGKVIDAIRILSENGTRVDSNTIITQKNKMELLKLSDMLSNIGVSRLTYSRLINTGLCSTIYDKMRLTTPELIGVKLKLVAHAKIKGYSISFDGGIVYFINSCGVEYRYPFITSTGNVVPCCCFRDKPIIGNIRENSYREIFGKYDKLRFKAPIKVFENCNNCLDRI